MDFKNIKDCIYKVSDHGDVKDMRTGKKLHKKIANKKHHPYYAVYLEDNNDKKRMGVSSPISCILFC